MTKKIYNLVRSTPEQIGLLLTFEKMVKVTRKQMTEHDRRKDISGLNAAIRTAAIKPKSIKNIIEGERKRLAPFLKERDAARAFHKLQALTPFNDAEMARILVKEGGSAASLASRLRQHGTTLEEKQIICEFQKENIIKAFELVDSFSFNLKKK